MEQSCPHSSRRPGSAAQQHRRWQYEVKRARILFERGLFRECAALATELLNRRGPPPLAVYAATLHFMHALSSEQCARVQHPLSSTKLPLLHSARDGYLTTLSLLPLPKSPMLTFYDDTESLLDDDDDDDDEDTASSVYSSGPPSPSPLSITPPEYDPHVSTPSSSPRAEVPGAWGSPLAELHPALRDKEEPEVPFPAPLSIRKTSTVSGSHTETTATGTMTVQNSPLQDYEYDDNALDDPLSTQTWLHERAAGRFNEHLTAFREMVDRHHTDTISLIIGAQEAQDNRSRTGALTRNLVYDENLKSMDRRARIDCLKKRDWERPRFDPERLQNLCERALADI